MSTAAKTDVTIRNPNQSEHFARLLSVGRLVEISHAGRVLARSRDALRLLELGRTLYNPVLYLPLGDVTAKLRERPETTHCPLKGDARYFDLLSPSGEEEVASIGWVYADPIPSAEILAGRIAFYADKVSIREGEA